jgi:hypothetical protein
MTQKQGEIGKAHGSETRKKSGLIGFRVDPLERDEIEQAAEGAGLTVGSYIRDIVLEKARTQKTRRPSFDRVLLSQLLGQLGKVGSNLNQIAKRLNEGKGVGADRITAACDDFLILKEELLKAIGGLGCDNQRQIEGERRTTGKLSPYTRKK